MPTKHTQKRAIEPFLKGLPKQKAADVSTRIEATLRDAKAGPRDDCDVLSALRDAEPLALHIEQERQRLGMLFYDDLLRHAQRLLQIPGIARLYQCHYRAVLVDEFQDLSLQQLDLALHSCSESRTFVGDPLQGIYSWAGARPAEVEEALRQICIGPNDLGVSFRSSPEVLRLVGAVSREVGGRVLTSHDPGSWFEGGFTSAGTFETAVKEAEFVRETCELITSRRSDATVGVICRSGWRRGEIDKEFNKAQSPCTRWDFAIDTFDVVKQIRECAVRLGERTDFSILRSSVLASIDPLDPDTAADLEEALDQLEALTTDGSSALEVLSRARGEISVEEPIPAGVHLLNAHLGKGQQFDWVFIPGFEEGNIPSFLATGARELEEEYRVLIVMLSRARHGVIVTRARRRLSNAGNSYSLSPSRWSSSIRGDFTGDLRSLREHIMRLPATTPGSLRLKDGIGTAAISSSGVCVERHASPS